LALVAICFPVLATHRLIDQGTDAFILSLTGIFAFSMGSDLYASAASLTLIAVGLPILATNGIIAHLTCTSIHACCMRTVGRACPFCSHINASTGSIAAVVIGESIFATDRRFILRA
jgi:hypothetical protein